MPSQLKQTLSLYTLHAQRCLWSYRLPSACLTGCSVVCSPGKFQTSLAALWQREWREELNLSCAVLLSFSIALRECILQRSYLVLLVGQTEVFNHTNRLHAMINEWKLTFSVFAATPQGQMEELCKYLALPSDLFQLFQEHRDPVTPLLQRLVINIWAMLVWSVIV